MRKIIFCSLVMLLMMTFAACSKPEVIKCPIVPEDEDITSETAIPTKILGEDDDDDSSDTQTQAVEDDSEKGTPEMFVIVYIADDYLELEKADETDDSDHTVYRCRVNVPYFHSKHFKEGDFVKVRYTENEEIGPGWINVITISEFPVETTPEE